MSRNTANSTVSSNPVETAKVSTLESVTAALSSYTPKRGIPTWKATGVTASQVSDVLLSDDGASIVAAWQDHKGPLAKLPASLLSEATMGAFMVSTPDKVETLKSIMVTAKQGQNSDSGDTLTDNAATAGKLAGERYALLLSAAQVLAQSIPEQVSQAGPDRIEAYVAAFRAAISGTPEAEQVSKLVGSQVNGNTSLASTYGKGTARVAHPVLSESESEGESE